MIVGVIWLRIALSLDAILELSTTTSCHAQLQSNGCIYSRAILLCKHASADAGITFSRVRHTGQIPSTQRLMISVVKEMSHADTRARTGRLHVLADRDLGQHAASTSRVGGCHTLRAAGASEFSKFVGRQTGVCGSWVWEWAHRSCRCSRAPSPRCCCVEFGWPRAADMPKMRSPLASPCQDPLVLLLHESTRTGPPERICQRLDARGAAELSGKAQRECHGERVPRRCLARID